MKTYWLTIAGLVVLALVALFMTKVLWLAETEPLAESRHSTQTRETSKSASQTQPKPQQPEKMSNLQARLKAKPAFKLAKPMWTKFAENRELKALALDKRVKFSAGSHKNMHGSEKQMVFKQKSNSTWTKKPRKLLRKPPKRDQREIGATNRGREMFPPDIPPQ
jgi:hypothetical protein